MPQEELKCNNCGAAFRIQETILNRVVCRYCGSLYVLTPQVARVIVNNQPNVNQLIDRAWAIKNDGNLDDAVTLYQEIVRFVPANVNVKITLAGWLREQGKPEEAIQLYHEVVRLSPTNANVRFTLADWLRQAGDTAGAAAMREDAMRIRDMGK